MKTKIKIGLLTAILCNVSLVNAEDGTLGHRVNYSQPNENAASNLKIGTPCFDFASPLNSKWITGFKSAIYQLNNSGANINLTWVDTCDSSKVNYGFDISVYISQTDFYGNTWGNGTLDKDQTVAQAARGSDSGVGLYIIFNPAINNNYSSKAFKVNTALHEIMHNLGVEHSYTNEGLPVSGTFAPYINDPKDSAIREAITNIDRLNYYDKKTLMSIYPK